MSTIETSPIHSRALPTHRTRRLVIVTVMMLMASAAYGAYWWSYDRFYVRTDNAYVTGNFIPVSAQASGIITQVLTEAGHPHVLLKRSLYFGKDIMLDGTAHQAGTSSIASTA